MSYSVSGIDAQTTRLLSDACLGEGLGAARRSLLVVGDLVMSSRQLCRIRKLCETTQHPIETG